MAEPQLLSDEDVGIGAPGDLQSDADVGMAGLQSDQDVGLAAPKTWWERGQVRPTALTMDPSLRTAPYVQNVMSAFGHGFMEGYGQDPLGVSPENKKILQDAGFFRTGDGDQFNPFKALNEVLAHAVVGTGDLALRLPGAALRGGQEALVEAGFPRDFAAIPEAFFGDAHPTGIPKGYPAVKVKGEAVVINTAHDTRGGGGSASFTATVEGPPSVTAYHGSPHEFERFDIGKVGIGEGHQSYGHGLYLAENKTVGAEYQKRLGATKIDGRPFDINNPVHKAVALVDEFGSREAAVAEAKARVAHDPADDFYGDVLRRLESDKPLPKLEATGNLYQVRINADPAHFLEWDKPLSEQSQAVQDAFKAHPGVTLDMTGARAYEVVKEAALPSNEILSKTNTRTDAEFYQEQQRQASQALRDAGIPGIKYLDQGSRVDPFNAEFVKDAIQRNKADLKLTKDPAEIQSIHDEIARLQDRLAKGFAPEKQTSNFVVFDHDLIEITHKNGEALLTERLAQEARDLGVIGPERPSINEGTPEEAAKAATADPAAPEQPAVKPPDGTYDWQARFDQFVGKLVQPKDVKRLIRNAASENDNFPAARQGDIKMEHVEKVAEAAGVEPGEINARGLGRMLRNDREVRFAMHLMVTATENVKSLAKDVVADASEQNLIKFQESILRRDLAVEQIVGLRSEWGRTGNVFQEFMREVKDGEALDTFLKDKCPL